MLCCISDLFRTWTMVAHDSDYVQVFTCCMIRDAWLGRTWSSHTRAAKRDLPHLQSGPSKLGKAEAGLLGHRKQAANQVVCCRSLHGLRMVDIKRLLMPKDLIDICVGQAAGRCWGGGGC